MKYEVQLKIDVAKEMKESFYAYCKRHNVTVSACLRQLVTFALNTEPKEEKADD